MADNKINLVITTNAPEALNKTAEAANNTAKGVMSAKQELRALQKAMGDMDVNSKEFALAAERAGKLKDQLNDAADAVKGSTGPAMESMNNTFGVMRGQIENLDFGGLGQSFASLGRSVGKISFKEIRQEIGGLIKGLGQLAKAVVTNPYLALAGAIALIVMNFDTIIKQFPAIEKGLTGINQIERDTLEIQKQRAENSKHTYDTMSKLDNLLKAQGLSEKEILQYKMKQLETSIRDAKIVLQTQKDQATAQILTAQRNRQILEGVIKWINAPLYLLLSTVDKIASWVGQETNLAEGLVNLAADLIIDPNEKADELAQSFQAQSDTILQMENEYAGFKQSITEIDRKAAEERKRIAKAEADEKERIQKEADEKEMKRRKDLLDAENAEDGKMQGLGLDNMIKREQEITNKQVELSLDRARKLTEIDEKRSEEAIRLEQLTQQVRLSQVSEGLSALMALNDAFTKAGAKQSEKQFQINKALNLASAVMDTYSGINRALNDKTMPSTAARIAQAIIVGTMGLANVLKISKTQYGSTSVSGGGNMSPSGVGGNNGTQTPNTSALSLSFLNNIPQQQPPIQAYVIGQQVNTSIEAQTLIRNQAKLH